MGLCVLTEGGCLNNLGIRVIWKEEKVIKEELSKELTALQWQDKRLVTMLSTIHNDDMISKRQRTRLAAGGREEIQKPVMIEEYNTHMGGVDKSDQLLSYNGSIIGQ